VPDYHKTLRKRCFVRFSYQPSERMVFVFSLLGFLHCVRASEDLNFV